MDRAYAVLGEFGARDTAQAAISLARFKDAKRMLRWQPLVRALQDKARDGMAEMTPKVWMYVGGGLCCGLESQLRAPIPATFPSTIQELAMTINAFANLPEPPGKAYWDEFSRYFLPQAEEFDKQVRPQTFR